ncbi:MAG: tRNA (adenine(57)-N(1)/adenine(58)-N(1))-methyltransferase TrmI [Candidatus Woesearchaeota archaeon]|nr:tRNA (adenine(57)-N(1)/adenine(58)-N(1))-methyltransferase TrmI [Candidatus Woesearchaeota archaeon]
MVKYVFYTEKGKRFYSKDGKDMHTQYGYLTSEDIKKAKFGQTLETNTGKKMSKIKPSFMDVYTRIKRGAQIIPLKDIGVILTETGINNKSKIVDAGAGSGGLACFLANIAKQVTTYDIREDFIKIVEKNKKLLNLKNLRIKKGSVYEKIDEKNIDLITLDLPEPWKAVENASKSLEVGGYIMSYSPCIPQVMDFVEEVNKHNELLFIKTIEIIERKWDINKRKVRPKTQTIGHSGFMTFVRKIKN